MNNPIIEAIGRCNPDEPLVPGDPRWYNFDPVRGVELHRRIRRQLETEEVQHRFCHIALAGHRGCGKSTELARVIEDVRGLGYLPLQAAVTEQVDENEVGFGDIVLLMLRLMDNAFGNPKYNLQPLPERTVNLVREWFQEVTEVKEQEIERALEYTGQAGLGINTPLAKLLSGLSALRRTTGRRRQEIKELIERYPDQLRHQINLLLDDAREIARKDYPKGIIFVLDNLDRYPAEMISRQVLARAELFRGVQAHMIFTIPISLLYENIGESISDRYQCETLPMLPVFRRLAPQTADAETIAALTGAIYKRVRPELFASHDLAEEIARLSGGCPRDCLRLLKEALLESDERIEPRSVHRAMSIVRSEMARKLSLEHYAALARVYLDGEINSDDQGRFLLYRRAALEYNGERWVGVHPLLWQTRELMAAVEAEKRARGASLQP
jgi:hypothetical protein